MKRLLRETFTFALFDMGEDNPMEILKQNNNVWNTREYTDNQIVNTIGDVGVIGIKFIIGAGVILFIACLISMLFIKNDVRMFEEKKRQITKIIVTIWIAASAVTIFGTIYALLNNIF